MILAVVLFSISLGLLVPVAAELLIPGTRLRFHVNTTGPEVVAVDGMYDIKAPSQISGAVSEEVNVGFGSTVTFTNSVEAQPLAIRSYWIGTVIGSAVELNRNVGGKVDEGLLVPLENA